MKLNIENIKKNSDGFSLNDKEKELKKYYKTVSEVTVEVDRQEFMDKGFSLADSEVERFKKSGWNTEYVEITRYCNDRLSVTLLIRFLVVKDEYKDLSEIIDITLEKILESENFEVLGKEFTFKKDENQAQSLISWREDLSCDLSDLHFKLLEKLNSYDLLESESSDEQFGTTRFVTISLYGDICGEELSVINKRIVEINENYFTNEINVSSSIY